jgi:hypothetical protein
MATPTFDKLVNATLNILTEGRKPKVQRDFIVDYDKLKNYIEQMPDDNVFKGAYKVVFNHLVTDAKGEPLSDEELKEFHYNPEQLRNSIRIALIDKVEEPSTRKEIADQVFKFIENRELLLPYTASNADAGGTYDSELAEKLFDYISAQPESVENVVSHFSGLLMKEPKEIKAAIESLIKNGDVSFEGGLLSVKEDSEDSGVSEIETDEDSLLGDEDSEDGLSEYDLDSLDPSSADAFREFDRSRKEAEEDIPEFDNY